MGDDLDAVGEFHTCDQLWPAEIRREMATKAERNQFRTEFRGFKDHTVEELRAIRSELADVRRDLDALKEHVGHTSGWLPCGSGGVPPGGGGPHTRAQRGRTLPAVVGERLWILSLVRRCGQGYYPKKPAYSG